MSVLQILAFLCGLGGLGATIGATVSNEWRQTSRASSVITVTWVLQGLWKNCAGNAIGAVHCRPHHTIFQLAGKIMGCHSDHITSLFSHCCMTHLSYSGWKQIKCVNIIYVLTYGKVLCVYCGGALRNALTH